jgi:SagB-type dehydrogenase family enzyme
MRRSVRSYLPDPLTIAELSYLLWVTQGVQRITSRPATLRPVPSAGSRHPFETYLLCNRVEGLEPGLYKYAALDHRLVTVDTSEETIGRFAGAICGQPTTIVTANAVTFIWVAVAYRSAWRYSERAYRFMHLDAGHLCQNLYLGVLEVGAGCCAIGGYHDDVINALLGLDGKERFVIYAAAIGKVEPRRPGVSL